jgi:hypothetical protein
MAVTWILIGTVSPRLKGWVVMDVEEADEASLDNMRQGYDFLRRSRLGRLHLNTTALMIVCSFLLQYLYSSIFASRFPGDLTGFIGQFLAITNLIEMVLVLFFTNRMIGWLGVGSANLFYPLSTLAAFLGIGTFTLPAALFGRVHRETLENSVSASCRNLLYNAYPKRFRGRVRAFLEGMVTNAGAVVSGLALMGLSVFLPPALLGPFVVGTGLVTAVAYLGTSLAIRGEYAQAVVKGLSLWHLDLDDVSLEVDKFADADLLDLLEDLEDNQDQASLELIQRILDNLWKRGNQDPVLRALHHDNPRVGERALMVLGQQPDPAYLAHFHRLLGSPDARLRARALDAQSCGPPSPWPPRWRTSTPWYGPPQQLA